MITVVDYGVGNISAFMNVLGDLGASAVIARSREELEKSERIILPGVGSFDWAMERLNRSGMRDVLDSLVLDHEVPVLGVCVGMQMMAKASEEGASDGLGWIDGEVRSLRGMSGCADVILPHMGWNDVEAVVDGPLFRTGEQQRYYFLHSYYFHPRSSDVVSATCNYGATFACAVNQGNVFGVQFHPEKSHGWGSTVLRRFASL